MFKQTSQEEVCKNVLLRNVDIHHRTLTESRTEDAFETREVVEEIFKELKIIDNMGGFYKCKRKTRNKSNEPPAIELRFLHN